MTTLKGLFDPKPRSQRNFLLENKRDVKTKSSSNSQKTKRELNLLQKQRVPSGLSKSMSPLGAVLESSASIQMQKLKGSVDLKQPSATSQQAKKASSRKFHPCSQESKPFRNDLNSKLTSNSRTMNYIHKENVPFEWTEVCPSLISHNICHQGVQTDRDEKYDVAQEPQTLRFAFSDSCDTKHVQIHKHSHDNTSDSTAFNKNKVDFNEGPSSENFHESELAENKHGLAFEGHGNVTPCRGEQQVDNSNLISDVENLKLSPTKKSTSNSKLAANPMLCPPSYRKGVVPGYISKRKTEALASARAKELDPTCPLGHVVMPDDERRETLDMVLKNYNHLIAELNKIPVRTDTLKMKQRKIEIEKQLDKLEEGIRIFSRSKVYVKLDV